MRINTNVAALNSYNQLKNTQNNLSKSLERLSSGKRINKAADDAAGLAISEKMKGQINGLAKAQRNGQDSISMIQTAEGALKETHSILQRMRELSVQAANDTNTNEDRLEIQKEMDQLLDEIDRIGNSTEFNTKKLLNGGVSSNSQVRSLDTSALTYGSTGVSDINVSSTSTLEADTYSMSVVTDSKEVTGNIDPHTTGVTDIEVAADTSLAEGLYTVDITGTTASTGTVTSSSVSAVDATNSELTDGTYALRITDATSGSETAELISVDSDGTETTVQRGIDISSQVSGGGGDIDVNGATFTIGSTVAAGESLSFSQETTYEAQLTDSSGSPVGSSVTVSDNDTDVVIGDILSGKTATMDVGTIAEGEATFNVGSTGNTTAILKDSSDNLVEQQTVTDNQKRVDLADTGLSFSTGSLASGDVTDIAIDVNGQDNSLKFQIGANEGQNMELGISDMRSNALGVDGVDVTSQTKAEATITTVQEAITSVSNERSKLGAVQNRLDHTINNLNTAEENLTAAESRISDVDMAKEMMNMSKQQILSQAGTAMMAQANQLPQGVLQLLG